jgi:hypothetical protein
MARVRICRIFQIPCETSRLDPFKFLHPIGKVVIPGKEQSHQPIDRLKTYPPLDKGKYEWNGCRWSYRNTQTEYTQ